MRPRILRIIHKLEETSSEFLTASDIANCLDVSTRQVLRYIKEIQVLAEEHGFIIHSLRGRGYRLQVVNPESFQIFCNGLEDGKRNLSDNETAQSIIRSIIKSDRKKLDDLAEQYCYSRSGMSRVMAEVNSYLETYGLSLNSKAYAGLYIDGSEISVRDCMYHMFHNMSCADCWSYLELKEIQLSQLQSWMEDCMVREKLTPGTEEEKQFLKYLIITAARLSKGKEICFGYLAHLDGKPRFQQQMIVTSEFLNHYFPWQNLNGESIYLTLIWMQTIAKGRQVRAIDEHSMTFFHKLVMKALYKIKINYGVDLSEDEILLNGLILHVASSYGKYLVHMESENPFYEELQKIYPTAYYYAIELAECIFEYTKLSITDNELGFLITYFASSIERNNTSFRVSTAILSNMAHGTVMLLKSRLEKNYKCLDVVGIYQEEEIEEHASEVDFYISVIPIEPEILSGRDVILLSPFLDEVDQARINTILKKMRYKSGIESVCQKDCFFIWDKPLKKAAILSKLCQILIQNGKMTEESEQAVMARENLVSTEISSLAALPHCIIPESSFLAFVLLKSPVMWGKTKVRLVILGCFQKGDTRIKEVLEQLFLMVSDDQKVNRLVASKNYEEFILCIKEYGGGCIC